MDKEPFRKWATEREVEAYALYRKKAYAEFLAEAAKCQDSWLLTCYRAVCNCNGWSVAKDVKLGISMVREMLPRVFDAAERGNAWAQYFLGRIYHFCGDVFVRHDDVIAFQWLEKSALQGFPTAQVDLANRYFHGEGVEKNEVLAAEWYCRAAEQGHAEAQNNLARCYRLGLGVKRNIDLAAELFRKAADQGFAESQYLLGRMYLRGLGVEKDQGQALMWFEKAASQGHAKADYQITLIHRKLVKEIIDVLFKPVEGKMAAAE